jgi:hypothetical protein
MQSAVIVIYSCVSANSDCFTALSRTENSCINNGYRCNIVIGCHCVPEDVVAFILVPEALAVG